MKVRFLVPWQGSEVGDVGEFVPFITDDLLSRKIVEPYPDEAQDRKLKDQAAEIAALKKERNKLKKELKAAPKNKMVEGADTK